MPKKEYPFFFKQMTLEDGTIFYVHSKKTGQRIGVTWRTIPYNWYVNVAPDQTFQEYLAGNPCIGFTRGPYRGKITAARYLYELNAKVK